MLLNLYEKNYDLNEQNVKKLSKLHEIEKEAENYSNSSYIIEVKTKNIFVKCLTS